MLRKALFWRILLVIYLAAVAYICFASQGDLPSFDEWPFKIPADKCVHFLMFLPFPVLAYLAFPRPAQKTRQSLLLSACILASGAVLAAGTEFVQGFLPYREADNSEFLADFLALCLSAAVILAIDLNKNRHA